MATADWTERWQALSAEVLSELQAWRAAHPTATVREIETAVEPRISRLRALLLEDAAQAIGASNMSRMFKHILPNVSHVALVQLSQHTVQFIKAEVIHWDELLDFGTWAKAKDVGKIRIEGKDYHPIDGDVMEFRFNV